MQLFLNLIGNTLASRTLLSMLEKKTIHHAFIFSGPAGVGKKLFALELAKGILGQQHSRKVAAMIHPDVRIFSPEGKSGIHPISSLQLLKEQMALEPFEADARVFIIEEADRMQPVGSNSLLKTLEEPPKKNFFILLTSQPDDIIPTIHSRCRQIPFFPIPEKEIYAYLKQHHDNDDSAIKKIAFLSHGSLQKANELITTPDDVKRKLLIDLLKTEGHSVCEMAPHIAKIETALTETSSGEENPLVFYTEVDRLFEEVFYWYRDLHLLAAGVSADFVFHLDALDVLMTKDKTSLPSLEQVSQWIEECRLAIHRSMKVKTVFEYLFTCLKQRNSY